jgi:hypothetical protein
MLHIYAALAEKERGLIADRTRAALAQKKAHGAILGNRSTNLPAAQAKGVAANREAADAFAANVLPIVRQIQAAGATTFRAIGACARPVAALGMALRCGTFWRGRVDRPSGPRWLLPGKAAVAADIICRLFMTHLGSGVCIAAIETMLIWSSRC